MQKIAQLADLFDHAEKRARKRWAVLKGDITNHENLSRYVRTLRACERIRNTIHTQTTHDHIEGHREIEADTVSGL